MPWQSRQGAPLLKRPHPERKMQVLLGGDRLAGQAALKQEMRGASNAVLSPTSEAASGLITHEAVCREGRWRAQGHPALPTGAKETPRPGPGAGTGKGRDPHRGFREGGTSRADGQLPATAADSGVLRQAPADKGEHSPQGPSELPRGQRPAPLTCGSPTGRSSTDSASAAVRWTA